MSMDIIFGDPKEDLLLLETLGLSTSMIALNGGKIAAINFHHILSCFQTQNNTAKKAMIAKK